MRQYKGVLMWILTKNVSLQTKKIDWASYSYAYTQKIKPSKSPFYLWWRIILLWCVISLYILWEWFGMIWNDLECVCNSYITQKKSAHQWSGRNVICARCYISRLYRLYNHQERASDRRISARDIYILPLMLLELLDVPLSVCLVWHIESLTDVLVCFCCVRSWCWLIVSVCVFLMS